MALALAPALARRSLRRRASAAMGDGIRSSFMPAVSLRQTSARASQRVARGKGSRTGAPRAGGSRVAEAMAKLVAQEVSAARRANHLTVEQLARRTHLEPWILDGLEHGQDVALSILARVAHALGVHLELVRSRTRAPRPAQALTAAPASLRPLLAPLRRALAKGHEPMARHEVGEIIASVKRAPDTYGMGAVVVLATAIGEDVPTLYRYASVAECWDRRAVRALLDDPTLTWSHLVLLARLPDDKQRATWMRRVRREKLSVRQLEARLSAA